MIFLYAIGAIDSGFIESVKIGVSVDVEKRLATLQTGNHKKLKLLYSLDVERSDWAYGTEAELHRVLQKHHLSGEWFSCEKPQVLSLISKFFQSGVKDPSHNWQPSSFYECGEI